jgi:hypothetical protein
MLPRNPPSANFHGLLDAFRSSKHVHYLVKLQLVAGAQFALCWVQKWKPQIDFNTISKGYPPQRSGDVRLLKHLEATYEPAKRIIDRLLETGAGYFEEHPSVVSPVRGKNLVYMTSQQPVQLARASYSDNTLKILSKDIFICMFRNEIFLFIT